jgi:hypothetical protein
MIGEWNSLDVHRTTTATARLSTLSRRQAPLSSRFAIAEKLTATTVSKSIVETKVAIIASCLLFRRNARNFARTYHTLPPREEKLRRFLRILKRG